MLKLKLQYFGYLMRRVDSCADFDAGKDWGQEEKGTTEDEIKNLPASEGATGDEGSITGSGRSPAEGNGYPLQYSCPENPMDRGAWWATVHGVTKSQT